MKKLRREARARHQIEGAEASARVVVNEKVDVASRIGFVAGHRAEQIKRDRAQRLDGAGVGIQLPECFRPSCFYRITGRRTAAACQ
jgi:hypothetical protein